MSSKLKEKITFCCSAHEVCLNFRLKIKMEIVIQNLCDCVWKRKIIFKVGTLIEGLKFILSTFINMDVCRECKSIMLTTKQF